MAGRTRRVKPATERRKAPQQERSGETVEAILEAAARILAESGPRALTTNRIAARAGVSVGSLYQYFPNKFAVARAVVERELARMEALRPAALDDVSRPPGERLRAAVDWLCDAHSADPALSRALHALLDRALPPVQRTALEALRTARTRRTVASLLAPDRDPDRAAFVVEVCLDAVIDRALARHPDWVHEERFRAELAALLERYLA